MSTYKPLQLGIPVQLKQDVIYSEFYPRTESPVYCFWSLETRALLKDDFRYLVLPDACVDIVFDVSHIPAFEGALIMTPDVTASTLTLGRSFQYVGVRLLPGTWQRPLHDVVGHALEANALMNYDFRRTRQQLLAAMPDERASILNDMVVSLERCGLIGATPLPSNALAYQTVEEYTRLWSVSRRHTQRLFQRRFGYAPHDFIKIIRFQRSLRQGSFEAYADQPHYSREFKRITNLTPREFQATYR
ncbi:helix-turn-helix domain-containing protein [Streptomyces sp. NPDC051662]|uniref:helix-turn-helix domain-containing protein n=1 Tax=Streptomyces sp. NPDC051662 TaxID=3154750 RepID=UPI003425E5B7